MSGIILSASRVLQHSIPTAYRSADADCRHREAKRLASGRRAWRECRGLILLCSSHGHMSISTHTHSCLLAFANVFPFPGLSSLPHLSLPADSYSSSRNAPGIVPSRKPIPDPLDWVLGPQRSSSSGQTIWVGGRPFPS